MCAKENLCHVWPSSKLRLVTAVCCNKCAEEPRTARAMLIVRSFLKRQVQGSKKTEALYRRLDDLVNERHSKGFQHLDSITANELLSLP